MKILKDLLAENKNVPTYIVAALIAGVLLMIVAGPLTGRGQNEPQNQLNDQNILAQPGEALQASQSGQQGQGQAQASQGSEAALEARLAEALSLVEGAGQVHVMLTFSQGRQTVFATDRNINYSTMQEQDNQGGSRQQNNHQSQDQTLIIADRPLVIQENPPQIGGVIIIAEGAGNIVVQDALMRATSTLLGIEINRVHVMTMKALE